MGKTSPSRRLGKFYSSAQAAFFFKLIFLGHNKKNLGWLIDVCFYTFLVKIITFDLQRVPLKIVNDPKGRQKWELQSECYQTCVKGRCLPCSTLRLFLSCRSQRNYVRMRIYALPFNMKMIFTLHSILQQIYFFICLFIYFFLILRKKWLLKHVKLKNYGNGSSSHIQVSEQMSL